MVNKYCAQNNIVNRSGNNLSGGSAKKLKYIPPTSQLSLDNKQADDAYEEELKADSFSDCPADYAYKNITPKPKTET